MKLALTLFLVLVSLSHRATAQDNPQLAFVSEYVRQLSENESNRALSEKELAEVKDDGQTHLQTTIRAATRNILALSSQIRMLQDMHLSGQLETVPGSIAEFYQEKIQAHQKMIDLASTMLAGPQPDVNYGALVAEAPKLTAKIEYIDHALFEATPLVFAALMDEKPDSKGHMSRLIITKMEKEQLLQKINSGFGDKLDQKNPNYLVGSAVLIRDFLTEKGYHCSDEPE